MVLHQKVFIMMAAFVIFKWVKYSQLVGGEYFCRIIILYGDMSLFNQGDNKTIMMVFFIGGVELFGMFYLYGKNLCGR